MNHRRPDHRDLLLRDVYQTGDTALPSRMAAHVRRRRRVRRAGAACALLAVAAFAFFHGLPALRKAPLELAATPRTGPAPTPSSIPVATDADLLAHLQNERVMVFTLADGRREVVWLDGRPRG